MSTPEARQRLLEQAAVRFGGVQNLARMLGVTQRAMKLHLSGAAPVPDALFLRLVDLLSDQGRIEGQRPPDGGPSSKRR